MHRAAFRPAALRGVVNFAKMVRFYWLTCTDTPTHSTPQSRPALARTYATAKPAASEVSNILEQRISGVGATGDVQETGRVLSEFLK